MKESTALIRNKETNMFGLLKALGETAKLPFDVVADVITLGGSMVDKDVPYTAKRCQRIMKKLNED